jgi:hypothetical protein
MAASQRFFIGAPSPQSAPRWGEEAIAASQRFFIGAAALRAALFHECGSPALACPPRDA